MSFQCGCHIDVAGHRLGVQQAHRDVPLKSTRPGRALLDAIAGVQPACRVHGYQHCPQGDLCIGQSETQWGALVWVRSRRREDGAVRITGFARPHGGHWTQVTPSLRPRAYDSELGYPLDWTTPGHVSGPLARWLDRAVRDSAGLAA